MPTALVTGATAGIGAAFARVLAAAGSDLVLVARDEDRLLTSATVLADRFGVHVAILAADLTTDEGCAAVGARLAAPDKPIDTLVNNAGMGLYRPFGQSTLAEEEALLDLNVRAVLRLTHAGVRAMQLRGGGEIINVSSVSAFVPRGVGATYSASKSWVTAFTEGVAQQLSGTPVRISAVCPGFTHTELHDRAQIDHSDLPNWMWLDADAVAADALIAVRKGRPVSVPGRQYKALLGLTRVLPRPVLRRALRGRKV